jgi:hypothetical protein
VCCLVFFAWSTSSFVILLSSSSLGKCARVSSIPDAGITCMPVYEAVHCQISPFELMLSSRWGSRWAALTLSYFFFLFSADVHVVVDWFEV